MNKKVATILQILALGVAPILLIATKLISFYFLLPLVSLVLIAVLIDIRKEGWDFQRLGFRLDNFKQSLLPYTLFTLVGLIVVAAISQILGKQVTPRWWIYPYFYIATIPFSFLQEFLYRSYLMEKLKAVFDKPWQIIVVNALLFALLHVIYPDAALLFPFGFLSGLAFATIYRYHPNLILITIVHAILNLSVITRCFFSLPGQHGC